MFDSDFLWHESWQEELGWEEEAEFVSAYHLSTDKVTDLPKISSGSIHVERKATLFWFMPKPIGSLCSEHRVPHSQEHGVRRWGWTRPCLWVENPCVSFLGGCPLPQVSCVGQTARSMALSSALPQCMLLDFGTGPSPKHVLLSFTFLSCMSPSWRLSRQYLNVVTCRMGPFNSHRPTKDIQLLCVWQ